MSLENDIQHINEGLNEKKRCSSCGEELVNYGGAGLVCTNPECKNTPEEVKNEAKISEKKGFHVGDKVVLVGGYGNQGTVRKVEITFDSVNVWVEWDSVKARGEKWDETYEPNDEDELELVRKPKNEAKIKEGKKLRKYLTDEEKKVYDDIDVHPNYDADLDAIVDESKVKEGQFVDAFVVELSGRGGVLASQSFKSLADAKIYIASIVKDMDEGDTIKIHSAEMEESKTDEKLTTSSDTSGQPANAVAADKVAKKSAAHNKKQEGK